MPERIVVSFRGVLSPTDRVRKSAPPAGDALPPQGGYFARALGTRLRAARLGGVPCAWSAQTFAFAFEPGAVARAVELAVGEACDETVPAPNRFGVGIAQGVLEVEETSAPGPAGAAPLSWGAPLVAAVALARVAAPGEVLVDPDLAAHRAGDLIMVGSRLAVDLGTRVRGARLDVRQPWRRDSAATVAKLLDPPLAGRDEALASLAVPVGSLGLVRADAGFGGTRFLHELVARLSPARWLYVAPIGASREPLGAVRRALGRSAAVVGGPVLPDKLRGVLDRLLAGEGADLWATAELIDTWLAPVEGRFGLLLVDDANEVNPVSLEALANAIAVRGAFRMVVRLDTTSPLPAALEPIPTSGTVALGPLARADAERVATGASGGAMSPLAQTRWARRGAGSPGAIVEGIALSLGTGELSWVGPEIVPRRRASGRGGTATLRQLLEQRLALLDRGERAALTALAMLGGDASESMVDELGVGMSGLAAREALASGSLVSARWATRPEPGWLRLHTRTAVDVALSALSPDERREWHVAAAETWIGHTGPLGRGDAAWHAARGGERDLAARLAIEAAEASVAAGLDTATKTLFSFAHEQSPTLAEAARKHSLKTPLGSIPPAPASARTPLDGLEDGVPLSLAAARLDSVRPPLDTMLEDAFAQFDPVRAVPPPPNPALEDVAIALSDDDIEETIRTKPQGDNAAGKLAERARAALVEGDVAMLEKLVEELRATGKHADLVERMGGFLSLARGKKADALRRLRVAAEESQPPAQRVRARLAYGVALAAAGRSEAALLEALLALSAAREAADKRGERACAQFLAKLSTTSGHAAAAAAWEQAAEAARRAAG